MTITDEAAHARYLVRHREELDRYRSELAAMDGEDLVIEVATYIDMPSDHTELLAVELRKRLVR